MILGSICCRGGSKGVPNKNIRPLHGVPLIVHSIRAAQKSLLLEDLVISTDSEKIASIATDSGARVPFMRPQELASDLANKWDVFRHVIKEYERLHKTRVSYLVDMDVTVPLKLADDIDGCIHRALENEDTDVVITGYEPERNPYFNMMEIGKDGWARIVKQTEDPIVRRQDAPLVYSLTPAAYVMKREAIFNYSHWSQAKCQIHPMPRNRAIDIDTEFDFELVDYVMEKQRENE